MKMQRNLSESGKVGNVERRETWCLKENEIAILRTESNDKSNVRY